MRVYSQSTPRISETIGTFCIRLINVLYIPSVFRYPRFNLNYEAGVLCFVVTHEKRQGKRDTHSHFLQQIYISTEIFGVERRSLTA